MPMLQGLAEVLAGMLPTGSKLVLHWRDTQGQSGMSAVSGTPEALREQAVAALEGCDQGRHRSRGGTDIEDVWEEAGLRIAVAARSKAACCASTRTFTTATRTRSRTCAPSCRVPALTRRDSTTRP